jgi:WD40 repeat protein
MSGRKVWRITRREAAFALLSASAAAQTAGRIRRHKASAEILASKFLPGARNRPHVLTSNSNDTVSIIDGSTGEVATSYQMFRFSQVAFFPDGLRAVSTGKEVAGKVVSWQVADGKKVGEYTWETGGKPGSLYAVAVSPDGQLLAAAGFDPFLYMWKVGANRPWKQVPVRNGRILALQFDQPSRLQILTETGSLGTYDGGSDIAFGGLDGKRLLQGSFSNDGKRVAATAGFEIDVWDAMEKKQISSQIVDDRSDSVYRVSLSDDGHVVAYASHRGLSVAADNGRTLPAVGLDYSARITSLCLAPDARSAFLSGEDGTYFIVDVASGLSPLG